MRTGLQSHIQRFVTLAFFLATVIPFLLVSQSALATSCIGVRIGPHTSIQSAIDAHAAGTTFCLRPGTYREPSTIYPSDRDRFVGMATHRSGVIVKTNTAEIIFELGGMTNVTFRHFVIKGARNACPRENCGPTGRAISGGIDVRIVEMRLTRNGLNGVGGTGKGLTLIRSEVDHNGVSAVDGVSGGIKAIATLSVIDSYVHDNRGNGVWCDIQCGHFVVRGSKITGNTASGIFDEISQGKAVFHGNRVKGNDIVGDDFRGGLSITNSKNVIAYNNVFARNRGFAIAARMDDRVNCGIAGPDCGYVISDVRIHHNVLHGNDLVGCELDGVACSHNKN